jgi:predicted AAA+ superfamily ATPase
VAVDHCKRWVPTYYIKGNKGEVDIAVVQDNRMYPVEVKWTKTIRSEDIKQIQGYKNGVILSRASGQGVLKDNIIVPFTRFLIHTGYNRLVIS